jgi:hypothetical protein
MNAWLITWEWLREPSKPVDRIVAILSSRRSTGSIRKLMELLYLRATGNAAQMAYYANRRKRLVCKGQDHGNYITCGFISGHAPWLCGRQVTDLKIVSNDATGEEVISWRELPEIIRDGADPVRFELAPEGKAKKYRRKRQPLDPCLHGGVY